MGCCESFKKKDEPASKHVENQPTIDTDQVIREIPIPKIPFPIPKFLKTQKKFKNPGIFSEFPLEQNHLECGCFYDKYNNSNINTMKVEMHKLAKMLLFNVIYMEML